MAKTILRDLFNNGLVQEKRNSSALAMELRLSCAKPSIWNVLPKSTQYAVATVLLVAMHLLFISILTHNQLEKYV